MPPISSIFLLLFLCVESEHSWGLTWHCWHWALLSQPQCRDEAGCLAVIWGAHPVCLAGFLAPEASRPPSRRVTDQQRDLGKDVSQLQPLRCFFRCSVNRKSPAGQPLGNHGKLSHWWNPVVSEASLADQANRTSLRDSQCGTESAQVRRESVIWATSHMPGVNPASLSQPNPLFLFLVQQEGEWGCGRWKPSLGKSQEVEGTQLKCKPMERPSGSWATGGLVSVSKYLP